MNYFFNSRPQRVSRQMTYDNNTFKQCIHILQIRKIRSILVQTSWF